MIRYAIPIALIAAPAHAGGFENREIAFQALNAADVATTCIVLGKGGRELNPVFGHDPSCAKIAGIKAGMGIVHYLVAKHLQDRDPKAAKLFQIISITLQGGAVGWNLQFVF